MVGDNERACIVIRQKDTEERLRATYQEERQYRVPRRLQSQTYRQRREWIWDEKVARIMHQIAAKRAA